VSPDGSRLAVARHARIEEYALPSGKRIATHMPEWRWLPDLERHRIFMVHTGPSIILGQAGDHETGLFACSDGYSRDQGTDLTEGEVTALAPTRRGFVAAVDAPAGTELAFGNSVGRLARRVALSADLGLDHDEVTPGALAIEPDSGLVALGGQELIVLAADASRVIARAPMPATLRQVAFTGPQSIVSTDGNRVLTRWHHDARKLTPLATAELLDDPRLAAIPMHNLIALQTRRKLRFRNATTLAPARAPMRSKRGRSTLWCSPVGGHLVLAGSNYMIEVHDPIAVLARRPVGETTPADLAIVDKATVKPCDPRAELVELLRSYLHHRFGSEIALGFAGIAADHDIAIGSVVGSDEEPL
jgi:hypothetical protein